MTTNDLVLPPGWHWEDSGAYGCHWEHTFEEHSREEAHAKAWESWTQETGITQAQWERMTKDHEAFEVLRKRTPEKGQVAIRIYTTYEDGAACWGTGTWSAEDPAQAVLAACTRKKL